MTTIDPVCGMTVGVTMVNYTASFEGKSYFFCSSSCLASFKADSAKYARTGEAEARHASPMWIYGRDD